MSSGSNGLHLKKLSRHVYNALNTFFYPITYEDIHKIVSSYVKNKAKDPNSAIERTSRGKYRINPLHSESEQLEFNFDFEKEL